MAEEGTFCNNAEVLRKAGSGASGVSSLEAYTNDYIKQAEAYINCLTRYDYTTNYATLTANAKLVLKEAASNLAAIYVIQYDPANYSSTRIAENIINTNWARFIQCLNVIQDQRTQTFIIG